MRRAIAIGNFDGVHLGHQAVLAQARSLAGADGEVVALTFWPHPLAILSPTGAPPLLCPLPQRVERLKLAGADQVEIIPFTAELAALSPAEFVEDVLGPLSPTVVVVGENYRFGDHASGGPSDLLKLGRGQFTLVELPLSCDAISGVTVSSSAIRQALTKGDLTLANRLLGRTFSYQGLVAHGDRRGRQLGFPTANLIISDDLAVPADGVYAGRLRVGAQSWTAAISVGANITFAGRQRRVEAHAIGVGGLDLYDQPAVVEFMIHLRGQVRFASVDQLVSQMQVDVAQARLLVHI
ncbi:MAG: riboflavin biosynthesis protein RibF [Propionibacteriaceae bacterium]|jgi:riboflavin kinase/FMN adenylyltransferase|nr:riboflavin biosynthesis protein RibF [Propionibacteriaceae bacterium]